MKYAIEYQSKDNDKWWNYTSKDSLESAIEVYNFLKIFKCSFRISEINKRVLELTKTEQVDYLLITPEELMVGDVIYAEIKEDNSYLSWSSYPNGCKVNASDLNDIFETAKQLVVKRTTIKEEWK